MEVYGIPPGDNQSDDGPYYQIFGRVKNDTVQMFIAEVRQGDTEYDRVRNRLGLEEFSTVVHDFEAAEGYAKSDARKQHSDYPIELRFMEDGEVTAPGAMSLIPVDADKPKTCACCGCGDASVEKWLSVYKWGYPFFCSRKCVNQWYELPFLPVSTGIVECQGGL
jgi:hypothetical protein